MKAYVVSPVSARGTPRNSLNIPRRRPPSWRGTLWSGSPIFGACAVLEGLGGQSLRYQPRDNAFHQSQAPQRDSGLRDVANLHHRAKHSRHHTKDKQRFVVSVVAYDSLPGHQVTIFCDVLRYWLGSAMPTGEGCRRMSGYGTAACGANQMFAGRPCRRWRLCPAVA